ncbi:MAG: carbamoyl phosphate synthase small subunit [Clostridia bacterium]|jgi:carbamoyl-phosphate synthase small subunit|uniref:carbamoyl phosphate synthase small subunit n=1 Tax=Pumilibacter muris TaxID=2941510 RepID=UPI00203E4DF4|nr:carbamoyl phosphate synthase small subunit [Pumilibacter muris]MCI8595838.1 carbamoyl phosphate synthase small subunit [Clostridia bacterium]
MKRYLILSDGSVFEGEAIGADGETVGEVVFTTAMVGYMETLTDPSYYGQIVAHTFPLIGNYGAIEADSESDAPALKGYVVREECFEGSNFRKESELDVFLKKHGIVGICGVDTRALTKKIRSKGVMNGTITSKKTLTPEKLKELKAYRVKDAVSSTTCKEERTLGSGSKRVVLWDFGAKGNIERELLKRDCTVIRVPAHTSAERIAELKPNGIMLTNGGGDPADNTDIIAELKKVNEYRIPTFGICLGHQLLALSRGASTSKLKFGHRGANQPVRDSVTGRTYITSQNHGYAVVRDTLPADAELRYSNANDKTAEGIDYSAIPAFSVQFHPEACGGPLDTNFLFDRFMELMSE